MSERFVPSASPVRAAVVGTGAIARHHLACLRTLPDVEIVGIADTSAARAASTAERFGVARWYASHVELLRDRRPDVVHVTTPANAHVAIAQESLEHGAHVIVEKPMAPSPDEARRLCRFAEREGLVLVENQNYVFDPRVLEIASWIASGELGDVAQVEVFVALDLYAPGSSYVDPDVRHPSLSLPGGALAEFATHMASLAWRFCGPARDVKNVWLCRVDPTRLPLDEFRSVLRFERAVGSLGFSGNSGPDVFSLRVHGTRMRVEANLFETGLTTERIGSGHRALDTYRRERRRGRDVRRNARISLVRKLSGGPGAYEGLWELLRRTYEAIAHGTRPPVESIQMLEVADMVAALTNPTTAS